MRGNSGALEGVYWCYEHNGPRGSQEMPVSRLAVAAATLFLSMLSGEREALPQPFRMTTLSGSGVDISRFEGRWFDELGNPVVVAYSGRDARFGVRLDFFGHYGVGEVSVRDDELRFYVWTVERGKFPVILKLVGADEAVMREVPPERPMGFGCCVCSYVHQTSLVRNPSPLWFMRIQAENAAEAIRRAYDFTFDRLSRIL